MRRAQSVLAWAVVLGITASIVLWLENSFKRKIAEHTKQMTSIAFWTNKGPTQWEENKFDENGNVIGKIKHKGYALLYHDDESKGKTRVLTNLDAQSVEQHRDGGTIKSKQELFNQQKVTQYGVGDGFEDWLEQVPMPE